jgi:hypothetical protein
MRPSLLAIDNFCPTIDQLRQEGLSVDYIRPNTQSSWSISDAPSCQTKELLSDIASIFGEELFDAYDPSSGSSVGRFSCAGRDADDQRTIHSDPFMWAGILYLHPSPPLGCGTSFFRDIESGRTHRQVPSDRSDLLSTLPLSPACKRSQLSKVTTISNEYNRLILFEATQFHAAEGFFGESSRRTSVRMTLNVFFNLGRPYRKTLTSPPI